MNCRAPIPKIRLRSLSSDALAIEAGPKRQRTGALPDATATSAAQFMVPMHGIKAVGAFHETGGILADKFVLHIQHKLVRTIQGFLALLTLLAAGGYTPTALGATFTASLDRSTISANE